MTKEITRHDLTETLVHVDSDHPAHKGMYKTLELLSIDGPDGPVFFVVEGCAKSDSLETVTRNHRYYYEEHTCPTNVLNAEIFVHCGDTDPHGIFRHHASTWLTAEYLSAKSNGHGDEYLCRLFPQMTRQEPTD